MMRRGYETAAFDAGGITRGGVVGGIRMAGVREERRSHSEPCSTPKSPTESPYREAEFRGVAATYGTIHQNNNAPEVMDVFMKGAFARSITGSRAVSLLENHETASLIATTADRLELEHDDHGLRFRCTVPPTAKGYSAADRVHREELTQVSVGFRPISFEEREIDGTKVRLIFDAELSEISLVRKGAVPGTSVTLYRVADPDPLDDVDFASAPILEHMANQVSRLGELLLRCR